MSIIKTTQDQNETPQKTTSFQKVKRSALPKYQPTYKSIYDDYVKLGLLSFPKGLVFPSPSKENCVSTDIWKWECCKQSNATVALCLGKDTPAITYTTRGTKPQHQLVSLAHMMSHHKVSHEQAVFHGTHMDTCSTRSTFCPYKLVLLRTRLLSSSFVCRNPFPHPTEQSWHHIN